MRNSEEGFDEKVEILKDSHDEEEFNIIEEEEENPLQFEDFSDEDLSSHALKVLNGEISINA